MKKLISAVLASVMIFSSFSAASVSAESYGDGMNIMILGDSIASGYGLDESEYNYGQLIGDYLDGTVNNYAVPGYDTSDVLAQVQNFGDQQKSKLAEADVVILSTGANDMIKYAANEILDMAVNIGALKDGKTAEDIPQDPTLMVINEFIDSDKLMEYANASFGNALAINDRFDNIYLNISSTDDKYKQILAKQVVPNIEQTVEEIKSVNPDVRVILQTVYNPFQYEKSYEDKLQASYTGYYSMVYTKMKAIFRNSVDKYSQRVKDIEGIEIADVYNDFSSLEIDPVTTYEQRYGWYFTRMQNSSGSFDVHPNQAGHLAMAVTLLNTIGEIHTDGGLLEQTYVYLPDRLHYPAYAFSQFEKIAGYYEFPVYALGDVNNDSLIDSDDASMALSEYSLLSSGMPTSFLPEQKDAADITGDGLIDADDASIILTFYSYVSTGGSIKDLKQWFNMQA